MSSPNSPPEATKSTKYSITPHQRLNVRQRHAAVGARKEFWHVADKAYSHMLDGIWRPDPSDVFAHDSHARQWLRSAPPLWGEAMSGQRRDPRRGQRLKQLETDFIHSSYGVTSDPQVAKRITQLDQARAKCDGYAERIKNTNWLCGLFLRVGRSRAEASHTRRYDRASRLMIPLLEERTQQTSQLVSHLDDWHHDLKSRLPSHAPQSISPPETRVNGVHKPSPVRGKGKQVVVDMEEPKVEAKEPKVETAPPHVETDTPESSSGKDHAPITLDRHAASSANARLRAELLLPPGARMSANQRASLQRSHSKP